MTLKERLKSYLPECEDVELDELLELSKSVILNKQYPFGNIPDDVEPRYHSLQILIAVEIYSKSGAEGETSHTENGVTRVYNSAYVSRDLLNQITPKGELL